jgi:hypothetical protein
MSNQQNTYDTKLAVIDNYLLKSGWKRVGDYWKPPAQIARIAHKYVHDRRKGKFARHHAIMIQVHLDEASTSITDTRSKPFGDVPGKDEARFAGERVLVKPRMKRVGLIEEGYTGVVERIRERGKLIEVRREKDGSLFRVWGERIERMHEKPLVLCAGLHEECQQVCRALTINYTAYPFKKIAEVKISGGEPNATLLSWKVLASGTFDILDELYLTAFSEGIRDQARRGQATRTNERKKQ